MTAMVTMVPVIRGSGADRDIATRGTDCSMTMTVADQGARCRWQYEICRKVKSTLEDTIKRRKEEGQKAVLYLRGSRVVLRHWKTCLLRLMCA